MTGGGGWPAFQILESGKPVGWITSADASLILGIENQGQLTLDNPSGDRTRLVTFIKRHQLNSPEAAISRAQIPSCLIELGPMTASGTTVKLTHCNKPGLDPKRDYHVKLKDLTELVSANQASQETLKQCMGRRVAGAACLMEIPAGLQIYQDQACEKPIVSKVDCSWVTNVTFFETRTEDPSCVWLKNADEATFFPKRICAGPVTCDGVRKFAACESSGESTCPTATQCYEKGVPPGQTQKAKIAKVEHPNGTVTASLKFARKDKTSFALCAGSFSKDGKSYSGAYPSKTGQCETENDLLAKAANDDQCLVPMSKKVTVTIADYNNTTSATDSKTSAETAK